MLASLLDFLPPGAGTFASGTGFALVVCWIGLRALIKTQREHIAELISERDDYRNKLHQEKGVHQGTMASLQLLQARPDLSTLEHLLKTYGEGVEAISRCLTSHIESDARIFASLQQTIESIPNAMVIQSKEFSKRQKSLMAEFKRAIKTK